MFAQFSEAEALQKAQGALGLQKGVRCVRTAFVALYVALSHATRFNLANLIASFDFSCRLYTHFDTIYYIYYDYIHSISLLALSYSYRQLRWLDSN